MCYGQTCGLFEKDLFFLHLWVTLIQCNHNLFFFQVMMSLSLASNGICASCRSIDCFKLFSSGWKLSSGGTLSSSAGLFVVFEFPLVHEMLLTSIFSIYIGCNVPITVCLGHELYHALC